MQCDYADDMNMNPAVVTSCSTEVWGDHTGFKITLNAYGTTPLSHSALIKIYFYSRLLFCSLPSVNVGKVATSGLSHFLKYKLLSEAWLFAC